MLVALTIELRDNLGGVLDRKWEHASALAAAMPSFDSNDYPILRLVDPYGDTVFSSYQMAAVIPELERLASSRDGPGIAEVLQIALRCRNDPHTFLVFIGD